MAVVEKNKFCPICLQMVHESVPFVAVKVFPSRTVYLHEGCAQKVSSYYREFDEAREEPEIENAA